MSSTENLVKRNVMSQEEEEALIEKIYSRVPQNDESDSDDELPYGGKVFLARRRKPDGWLCIAFQVNSF